jgi:hypothetical protein
MCHSSAQFSDHISFIHSSSFRWRQALSVIGIFFTGLHPLIYRLTTDLAVTGMEQPHVVDHVQVQQCGYFALFLSTIGALTHWLN